MKIRIIEPAGLHHAGAGVPGHRCGNDLLKMRGIGIKLIFICHGKGKCPSASAFSDHNAEYRNFHGQY